MGGIGMADRLTLGMVGCGGMAGAHRKGYQALWERGIRNFEIVATCDLARERAEKMADEVSAFQGKRPKAYATLKEMLKGEPGVAAVDISTVHREHHALAVACIEAGKHVTIEKPLGITMRAAKLILDAADEAGAVLQVAENYRRAPEERAANWALQEGRIGNVRMILWIDVGERLWYWAWREHKHQAGGGWPLDGGVHFADLFRYHVGEVRTVYAGVRACNPIRYKKHETLEEPVEVDVDDTSLAVLTFDNGVLGQWISTSAAPGHKFSQRVVYGDLGSFHWTEGLRTRTEQLTVEQLRAQYLDALDADERERLFPRGITDTVAIELKEFVDAVLLGTEVETDGLEGYKSEAVCLALYESAFLGQPVHVAQIERCELEGYQSEINQGLGL